MGISSKISLRTRLRSLLHHVRLPDAKPLILMYHRIADDPIDPFGLSVSPRLFDEQLRVLRQTRYPLPLSKFVSELVRGTLRPDAVAITFDDGYVDNLTVAKPSLAKWDIPATVFLTTNFLDHPEEIWSDELVRLVLLGIGPSSLDLLINERRITVDLGPTDCILQDGSVDATAMAERQGAMRKIWQIIRLLSEKQRDMVLGQLRSVFSLHGRCSDRGRAMTRGEVQLLVKDGLISIGAHTVSHPVLPKLEEDARTREILESKLRCEDLIGEIVNSFAYPFGEFDERTRNAVAVAGYNFACAVGYGPALPASDVFALPRIQVRNWHGDAFHRALRLASAGVRARYPSGVDLKHNFSAN